MEQPHDTQSEFARALQGSGYDFDRLRRRQESKAKKARRQAAALGSGGLLMLTAFSAEMTQPQNSWYDKAVLVGDLVYAGAAFKFSRDKMRQHGLLRRAAQSSNYLAAGADDRRSNDMTNADNTNEFA